MDIFDLPLTWLIGIIIGLTVLFVLINGLRLPSNFTERQRARSELKQKVQAMEDEIEAESVKEESG